MADANLAQDPAVAEAKARRAAQRRVWLTRLAGFVAVAGLLWLWWLLLLLLLSV